MPSVFVSYSHDSPEHIQRVLELANALRRNGVQSELDQFHQHKLQHWPDWCQEQIAADKHDYVICVCTPEYRDRLDNNVDADVGRGVFWEGRLLRNQIYNDKQNRRFIPVQFDAFDDSAVPDVLRGSTRFCLTDFDHDNDQQFRTLLLLLFGKIAVHQEPVGDAPSFIRQGSHELLTRGDLESALRELSASPLEQLAPQTDFAELVPAKPRVTLRIEQRTLGEGQHAIQLAVERSDQPRQTASAEIEFALSPREEADLRWYLEDYLQRPEAVTPEQVEQIEAWMQARGEELYRKVLRANEDTQDLWSGVRPHMADLRVEIATTVADAAAIPWELMYDPKSDSPIALRVKSFVRVQSNPNANFVPVPESPDGRVRLLYVVCRPSGTEDVEMRAIVNRLLQDLGDDLSRFDITALRPPTYEQLQQVLTNANAAGRPFHIVHFDGHGIYADLAQTSMKDWLAMLSSVMLGGDSKGKRGYLLFEHPGSDDKMRPVPGDQLGKLLHDCGVPVLVLNACQSAMHDAGSFNGKPIGDCEDTSTGNGAATSPSPDTPPPIGSPLNDPANTHDEVRAIGSLAQAVVDQGIPAVLGMRYSVYVVTAAQYIGRLYAALAKGRGFGEAASEGRKHLQANPDRWVGLTPRTLQDWCVPVVYEASRIQLLEPKTKAPAGTSPLILDPLHTNPDLLRYVPDTGFIGRDETLLLLDRAFDTTPVVLLHAYAGQGKTTTAVEFARWYTMTGGLGEQPIVMVTSFESHTNLDDALNVIGRAFGQILEANGMDWHSMNAPGVRRQMAIRLLQAIPVLWVWDNVEPVAGFPQGTPSAWMPDEQRELAEFLKQIKLDKATQAKVLLTSRRDEQTWLGGVPYRVRMPRMRLSDASKLAMQLGAERNLTRTEIAEWHPLLEYCQGNPLTLRVLVGQALRMGLRGEEPIKSFVQAVRDGEQQIEDADASQGRDVSLGASLDYGFREAFSEDELPIVALLHLFQGFVDAEVLEWMGADWNEHALPELVRWPSKAVDGEQSTASDGLGRPSYAALLNRASETGLLTHLDGPYYTIHPALPWFLRQLFARCYPVGRIKADMNAGTAQATADEEVTSPVNETVDPSAAAPADQRLARSGLQSTATAALRAWVEAIGQLSNHYHAQFQHGNRDVIQPLSFEESNLLHARRVSRRHGWWSRVCHPMQGLRVLYQYQGRTSEWSRLVAEIVPDYCTATDAPVPGGEADYSVVMGYRVDLAKDVDRDLPHAARLQEQRVAWDRQQAAAAIALPPEAPLDADQRNRIRSLGVGLTILAHILMEQNSPACVSAYEESIRPYERINDTAAEAITHFNLGHAYKDIPDIRDLDEAEAAYQRSLDLFDANDPLNRAKAEQAIGMVHHERFNESRAALVGRTSQSVPPDGTDAADLEVRRTTENAVLAHAQAAESHYQRALSLCPATALTDLGPIHHQLGNFYQQVGQTEQAREHYEKCVQLDEQTGNHFGAGQTRYNLAVMYLGEADRESTASRRETLFRRAQAYAAAALRDFQHYQGRAAADEADAQQLIDHIQQQLDQS